MQEQDLGSIQGLGRQILLWSFAPLFLHSKTNLGDIVLEQLVHIDPGGAKEQDVPFVWGRRYYKARLLQLVAARLMVSLNPTDTERFAFPYHPVDKAASSSPSPTTL
jgi:hypothetical protein